MVLKRSSQTAGFCSASVLAQDAVLTAAHCVASPANTRIYFRGSHGEAIFAGIRDIIPHPGYRTGAAQTRQVSIDLALIRLAEPLPAQFKALSLAQGGKIEPGEGFRIAGFGVTQENAASTSGILRSARIAARLPMSSILLWASDPQGRGTGACTGDSGGPILALDEPVLVAVTDWAEGAGQQKCGALTQGALITPQREWIERVLADWTKEK